MTDYTKENREKIKQEGYKVLNRLPVNQIYIECLKDWKTKKELSDIIRRKSHKRKKPSQDIEFFTTLLLEMGYLETKKAYIKKKKQSYNITYYKSNFNPLYEFMYEEKDLRLLTDIGKRIFALFFGFLDFNKLIGKNDKIIDSFSDTYKGMREELIIEEIERIKNAEMLAYLTRTDTHFHIPEMHKIETAYLLITEKETFSRDMLDNYLITGENKEKIIEKINDMWSILDIDKKTFEEYIKKKPLKIPNNMRKHFFKYSFYKKELNGLKKKYSDYKFHFLMDLIADSQPILFFSFCSIFLTKLEKDLLSEKIQRIISDKILPIMKEERLKDYFNKIADKELLDYLNIIKKNNPSMNEEQIKEAYLKSCITRMPISRIFYILYGITEDKKYSKEGDNMSKKFTEKFMRIGKERLNLISV